MRIEDEKIIKLRKAKHLSKSDLAAVIYSDVNKVNKVEKGIAQYTGEQMKLIKDSFDIQHMPLTEYECAVAKERLYVMRDYARNGRLKEAKKICDEMAKLVNLEPCDNDLPMLYRLFEVVVLLTDNKIDVAEEKLNHLQDHVENMSTEQRYHFYCNMGLLGIHCVRYEESLEFCLKALGLIEECKDFVPDDVERLHIYIVLCYTYLQFPHRAISYALKTREHYTKGRINTVDLNVDLSLANNYIRVNELEEAEKLLNDCLIRAESIKDGVRTSVALRNLCLIQIKKENWKEALEFIDKALSYLSKDSTQYFLALYRKIRCLVGAKRFSKARQLLENTLPLCNKDEMLSRIFESLSYYVTVQSRISVYNDKEAEYLENVSIPFLRKIHDHCEAIDYLKLLEAYYDGKNNKKSLLMSKAIREIYEERLVNC